MPFAPHSNTETRLWRTLRNEYGQRFNAVRFMNLCRLARFTFGMTARQSVLMQNFRPTWHSFLHNASAMHEFDWCLRLIEILEGEVRIAVPLPMIAPMERSQYFRFDLARWFGKNPTRRTRVQQRLSLVRAAERVGISALSLLLDHDLVDVAVLRRI